MTNNNNNIKNNDWFLSEYWSPKNSTRTHQDAVSQSVYWALSIITLPQDFEELNLIFITKTKKTNLIDPDGVVPDFSRCEPDQTLPICRFFNSMLYLFSTWWGHCGCKLRFLWLYRDGERCCFILVFFLRVERELGDGTVFTCQSNIELLKKSRPKVTKMLAY